MLGLLKIYVLSEYKHRKTVFYCFSPAARVFYITLVYSNARSVLHGLGFFICILNDILAGASR